jgi:hypothetical protein
VPPSGIGARAAFAAAIIWPKTDQTSDPATAYAASPPPTLVVLFSARAV